MMMMMKKREMIIFIIIQKGRPIKNLHIQVFQNTAAIYYFIECQYERFEFENISTKNILFVY